MRSRAGSIARASTRKSSTSCWRRETSLRFRAPRSASASWATMSSTIATSARASCSNFRRLAGSSAPTRPPSRTRKPRRGSASSSRSPGPAPRSPPSSGRAVAGVRKNAAQRAYRARRIGLTFGRIYLGIRAHRFLARRLRPHDMPERWRRFHRQSARTIYDTAIDLQGLILKGCQFLGSRADVLPREYVEVLAGLQDRVPPRPFAVVKACVERELGVELAQVFRSFEATPVASASLAQVHAAELQNGERVAVKVQYPEIEALVRSDLANVRTLFRAVGLLESDFDLMPLIDELAEQMPRELNFVNEGHNAEAIGRRFKERDDIAIPRIHWEFTTRRVLVMEYMD
ncbi:MAG: AarF/ABC1/UbiB kinase family protein, partial [Myxococcales bacterium]